MFFSVLVYYMTIFRESTRQVQLAASVACMVMHDSTLHDSTLHYAIFRYVYAEPYQGGVCIYE